MSKGQGTSALLPYLNTAQRQGKRVTATPIMQSDQVTSIAHRADTPFNISGAYISIFTPYTIMHAPRFSDLSVPCKGDPEIYAR